MPIIIHQVYMGRLCQSSGVFKLSGRPDRNSVMMNEAGRDN